jgi:putative ABC transport system substrate-binding protein
VKRRTFVALIGTAAIVRPPAVRAQPKASPVIGFLSLASPWAPFVAAFRQGLNETGYVEGNNVEIQFRWADRVNDRLPALVTELVRRNVAVLVVAGGNSPALAAKGATATTPIVFVLGADPVKLGLVANLGRPGGNATGVMFFAGQLLPKRLELLHELVPKASLIALLVNPDNPLVESNVKEMQEAAHALGRRVQVLEAHTQQEIDAAFAASVQLRAGALFVGSDGFFFARHEQFAALARRHAIPTTFDVRVRYRGWTDELRCQLLRSLSRGGRLHRENPQRRQAGRFAGSAADESGAGDQPKNREGTRIVDPAVAAAARG